MALFSFLSTELVSMLLSFVSWLPVYFFYSSSLLNLLVQLQDFDGPLLPLKCVRLVCRSLCEIAHSFFWKQVILDLLAADTDYILQYLDFLQTRPDIRESIHIIILRVPTAIFIPSLSPSCNPDVQSAFERLLVSLPNLTSLRYDSSPSTFYEDALTIC
jgi:ABC-type transport system involved in multi-copper enzyme maturation permease subunit